jgi:hypothetical protein
MAMGRTVRVRSEIQLYQAIRNLRSNTTILIEPGTYHITQVLLIRGGIKNVSLRGNSKDRNQVVLKGPGMRNRRPGAEFGIQVCDATDVTIANLSIGEFWFHPIQLQGHLGCRRVHIYNVRIFNAGEQFIKAARGVDDCTVEYCVFEFTDTARHWYTQGIDVLSSSGWKVRNNLFRNIRGPKNDPGVGGCIDFWTRSRNTLVENNIIVNSRMGIRLGIINRMAKEGIHDHSGGIIRNNVIWREPGAVISPDAGIMVWDSPDTQVLNNTVILNGTYSSAIEYRWCNQVTIANNLIDGKVWKRPQADGLESNNVVLRVQDVFAAAAAGDLHLSRHARDSLRLVPTLTLCSLDLDGKKRGDRSAPGAVDFPPR